MTGNNSVIDDVEERLTKLLGRSVMDYNDALTTTHADVVAVLRMIRGEFSHAV